MNFATANDVTLCYRSEGSPDGDPLVFINSLGTDFRIWDGLMPRFAPRFSILRYDKRGHGLSDCPPAPYSIRDHAADLAALLDRLDVERANLVGISVGGMIALDFAAAWPERVMSLVLCDTAAKIGTDDMWNARISALREHGMAYLGEAVLPRWFSPSFAERSPAAYRGYGNMLIRTPMEGYIGTCEALRDGDLRESTRSLQIRALVLCGADDMATPPDLVRGLADLMPDATYQEMPGAGHLPCIERPDDMARRIEMFL